MISRTALKCYMSLIALGFLEAIVIERLQDPRYNASCMVGGKVYHSGERIPRSHQCHLCMCRFGRPECFWMSCPPAPESCETFSMADECNPSLYVCPIPDDLVQARYGNRVSAITDEFDIASHTPNGTRGDCYVLGVPYKTGDVMGVATSFCLECRCARGDMFCSPKCCFSYAGYYETEEELLEKENNRGPRQKQPHPLYYLYFSTG